MERKERGEENGGEMERLPVLANCQDVGRILPNTRTRKLTKSQKLAS